MPTLECESMPKNLGTNNRKFELDTLYGTKLPIKYYIYMGQ